MQVGPKTYVQQSRTVSAWCDLREILSRIAVPTSVIVGEEDVLIPVAMSREIHDLTPGSTLYVIPGCGHLPPIEKPAIVADLLRKLMQEVYVHGVNEPGMISASVNNPSAAVTSCRKAVEAELVDAEPLRLFAPIGVR